jgi:hypothetical protein
MLYFPVNVFCVRPGLLNLLCVRKSSTKFGLHAGNMKLNTQNKKQIGVRVITRTILPVNVSIRHVQ